ncbi:hypothetical protein GCM10028805_55710 [Spirosoma harenae]
MQCTYNKQNFLLTANAYETDIFLLTSYPALNNDNLWAGANPGDCQWPRGHSGWKIPGVRNDDAPQS